MDRNGFSRSVTAGQLGFAGGLRKADAGSVAWRPQRNLSSGSSRRL